jgi:5-methylcytosine-specific restriction endonuclease McrA
VSLRIICLICGRPSQESRCHAHRLPRRSGTYTRDAKAVVQSATRCHLCGQGPRPGDPFVADHIQPRVLGGTDHPSNLAPAHRSCNGRKGQKLSGYRAGGHSEHVATPGDHASVPRERVGSWVDGG